MPATEIQHPYQGHAESVVISSGASLSATVNCGGRTMVSIRMPATWTAANLTFQASEAEGGTYGDLYDDVGTEYLVTAAAARWIALAPVAFAGPPFLKIRSGTAGAPVNQAAARTLVILFREID